MEELYFMLGKPALDRGYSVLTYEGPGQGDALRSQGLHFLPEWERPNGAVLDEFLRRHKRPEKIVLVGVSMGGYFAPAPSTTASTAWSPSTAATISAASSKAS
jgi:alpha-beta hydrolase superfamily lysophospholipase